MRPIHCNCAELPRVCAPSRTGSNRHYSHFRRNFGAPVDLLLRGGSARCVVNSRRNQDVTSQRGFSTCWIFACVERSWSLSASGATDAASERDSEVAVTSVTMCNIGASVDEPVTSETMHRLRRWKWTSTRAAPRRCYVEAALRSRRLDRCRETLAATVATMTQLQWIARIRSCVFLG